MWACQGHTHNLWGYRNPSRKHILSPASEEIGPTDNLTLSSLQNCETTSTPTCATQLQVPQPKVPYLQGQPTSKQNYLKKNLYWTCTDPPLSLLSVFAEAPSCSLRRNLVKWWQGLVRRLLLSSSYDRGHTQGRQIKQILGIRKTLTLLLKYFVSPVHTLSQQTFTGYLLCSRHCTWTENIHSILCI